MEEPFERTCQVKKTESYEYRGVKYEKIYEIQTSKSKGSPGTGRIAAVTFRVKSFDGATQMFYGNLNSLKAMIRKEKKIRAAYSAAASRLRSEIEKGFPGSAHPLCSNAWQFSCGAVKGFAWIRRNKDVGDFEVRLRFEEPIPLASFDERGAASSGLPSHHEFGSADEFKLGALSYEETLIGMLTQLTSGKQ